MSIAPEPELHEGFSEPGSSPVAWADVEAVLRESEISWLSTVRRERYSRSAIDAL